MSPVVSIILIVVGATACIGLLLYWIDGGFDKPYEHTYTTPKTYVDGGDKMTDEELNALNAALVQMEEGKLISPYVRDKYMELAHSNPTAVRGSAMELINAAKPKEDDPCAECGNMFHMEDDYLCPGCRAKVG